MNAEELRGRVEYGLITIREDEAAAVLTRLPFSRRARGKRTYEIAALPMEEDSGRLIAHVRCRGVQGPMEARRTAQALIDDLAPKWILLVGIAGTVPNEDVTLGDVVISSSLYDTTVGAAKPGRRREFSLGKPTLHREARDVIARVPAILREIGDWVARGEFTCPRPAVAFGTLSLSGSKEWQKKIQESLSHHFGAGTRRPAAPVVSAVAFASGGELVKDPSVVETWLPSARDVKAVEMEFGGVYEACTNDDGSGIPLLSIRGISDVVGLKREPAWTEYACQSAAAFTVALIKSQAIEFQTSVTKQTRVSSNSVIRAANIFEHPYERNVSEILHVARRDRGQSLALLGPPGMGKSLILRDVVARLDGIRTAVWLNAGELSLEDFDKDILKRMPGATESTTFDDLADWKPPLFLVIDGFQAYFTDPKKMSPGAYRVWPARLRALTIERPAVVALCGSVDPRHLYDGYGLRHDFDRGSWNLTPISISLKPDYPAWFNRLAAATGQPIQEIERLATLADYRPAVLMSALDALNFGNSPDKAIADAHRSCAQEIMDAAAPCCRRLLTHLAMAHKETTQGVPELADCAVALEAAGFVIASPEGPRLASDKWAKVWA